MKTIVLDSTNIDQLKHCKNCNALTTNTAHCDECLKYTPSSPEPRPQAAPELCDSCLYAFQEDGADYETAAILAPEWGDQITDHYCDNPRRCPCRCH